MLLRVSLTFLLIALGFVAVTVLLMPSWQLDRPATCFPNDCFCEATRLDSPLRQPVNAFTSLAYVLAGLFVAWGSAPSAARPFFSQALFRWILSLSAIVVGLGSAYYHATLTFTGQFLDVMGMYFVATFMVAYAWKRLAALDVTRFGLLYIVVNVILALVLIALPDLRRWFFAVILVVGIVLELALYSTRRLQVSIARFVAGLMLFALAYGIWILDNARVVCDPTSLLQGHGLWHLLGAAATVLLYQYYASETDARA